MDNLGYLLAAFAAIWIVIFAYVLYLRRKQKNLERQLARLQEYADKIDIK